MERRKKNFKNLSQEDFLEEIDQNSHDVKPLYVKRGIIGRIWVMLKGIVVMYSMLRYSRHRAKVIKESIRRSREDIQIMEYRGRMYICYKGMPIVGEEDLGSPWSEVIGRSRKVYQSWLSERELEK